MQSDIDRVGVENVGAGWVGTYTHDDGKRIAVVTSETPDQERARAAAVRFVQGPPDDACYAWGPHPKYSGRCGVFRLTRLGDHLVEEPV
jgi:hypothetical protein